MSLTYPTLEELSGLITAEFKTQLPSVDPTVFATWALSFAKGNAVLAQAISFLVRDLEKQMFPQTATDEWLEIWGGYEDLPRLTETPAFGGITIEGTVGNTILTTDEFLGSNGVIYLPDSVASIQTVTQTITSLTSSGTTATATLSSDHALATGIEVTIAGVTQTEYEGTYAVTPIANNKFTYQFAGSGTSPATTSTAITYETDIADINVTAQEDGVDTNLSSGAQFTNATYGTAYAQFDGLSGGASEEEDEAYRERIILSRSIIEGVFTPDQIKLAALSYTGNTRVFIKKPTLDIVSEHTITTLSSSSTTATAICAEAHGLQTGMEVTVSGATDAKYNITATITVTTTLNFTYTVVSGAGSDSGVWVGIGNALLPEPGQCSVFILRDNDLNLIPTQDILDDTKQIIIDNGALPANSPEDNLFVEAPTLTATDFTFTALNPDTPTMRSAVEDQLEAFFKDSVEIETDVTEASYLGTIQNTQDLETGAFLVSFALSAPSGDIEPTDGEIASLGIITWSI